MFILLLTSVLTLAFNIQPVRASGTIYIRADGSIDPLDAPISTVGNITYTLAGNISDSIMVERNNITVDGSGYVVQGSGDGCGFNLTGIVNVTIKNTSIRDFDYAIRLSSSNFSIIDGNNITNNHFGIYLRESSSNNIVSSNNIEANNESGILADSSSSNNTVSGNNITNHWCGIWLEGSSYSVSGNNITDNNFGIVLTGPCGNNTISGNNITANDLYGIELNRCSGNSVAGNAFVDDGLVAAWDSYGNAVVDNSVNGKPLVYLEGVSGVAVEEDAGQVILVNCSAITVEGLTLSHTAIGVELWNTNSTKISSNDISNNDYGILFGGSSSNNTVSNNNITANGGFGIELLESPDNKIYHNNFINNSNHALEQPGYIYTNVWDDAYPSGGNYWKNYWDNYNATDLYSGPYQNETGSDGIGDTSFSVPFGNRDRYPLMAPCSMFGAGSWNETACNVYVVSNSSVSGFQVDVTQKTLSFNVTGSESTAGFSRVAISNVIVQDLWQGDYTVLLNGEPCSFRDWTDATNTYIYVNYTHSQHEITIIPEFSPAVILPLFMMATLLAVIVYKRKTKISDVM
jgi:parallel beta-helix repeat protein